MTHFLGSHPGRIDAKGRVSIPAPFRTALRATERRAGHEEEALALVCWRSHKFPCIEAWPPSTFNRLARPLDELSVFSDEHDDLAATLFGESGILEADREGRIVLPPELAAHAAITSSVVFMGLGQVFQLWEPAAAARRLEDARARARAVRLPAATLRAGEAAA